MWFFFSTQIAVNELMRAAKDFISGNSNGSTEICLESESLFYLPRAFKEVLLASSFFYPFQDFVLKLEEIIEPSNQKSNWKRITQISKEKLGTAMPNYIYFCDTSNRNSSN